MQCPFCGDELRPGSIGARSYHGVRQEVVWQPDEGSSQRSSLRRMVQDPSADDVRLVVPSSDVGDGCRPAGYCERCGAVLTHPTRP